MGCQFVNYGVLNLQCEHLQRIYIVNSTYGSSTDECFHNDTCCPSSAICETDAEPHRVQLLRNQCNGKQNCVIHMYVEKETCIYATDYESVTYICSIKPPG